MKLLTCLIFTIALIAPLQAQTPSETEVKQELNEAALAYRKGNFVEAQAHSERALQLDPENKTALMYVARTIHVQYKPGDFTPENVAKAREAINAYQRIFDRSLVDEESYKAVAYLYDAIKEEELFREWVLQRAGNVALADDKRAEAYVVLASRDWDCSFKITELPRIQVTTINGNKRHDSYQLPKEFERAKECASRGLQLANMAITLTLENESAWSYKTNLLLELKSWLRCQESYSKKANSIDNTKKLLRRQRSSPTASRLSPNSRSTRWLEFCGIKDF
ncbi:MAG TPA: hypothetical protein VKB05_05070 [Pyrinomonadaceae bacterium]|nr:hypothetical protein [Pyrinomonadaceae bacterium]